MTDNMKPFKNAQPTDSALQRGAGRRTFLAGGAAIGTAALFPMNSAAAAPPSPARKGGLDRDRRPNSRTAARTAKQAVRSRRHTRVGIGYQTWFSERVIQFETTQAIPVLGKYRSDDVRVIRQHADWLMWAGVDYLLVDWSNNLGGNWKNGTAESIIAGTDALLNEYSRMKERPLITLLLGQDNGEVGTPHFLEQVEQIKKNYINDRRLRKLFMEHDGKPLLSIYTGARTTEPPEWNDDAFTVRYVGAFREIVLNPGGMWSWKDRSPFANGVETPQSDFAGSGLQGWTSSGGWKVNEITTRSAFDQTATVTCANSNPGEGGEQLRGTLTSPAFEISQSVISFNAIGADMAAREALPSTSGRNVFLLKDAGTGEILRHASPPGDPFNFHVRQWDVKDLIGRSVVFEAVNDNPFSYPLGWMGFDRLIQQRPEQVTVSPAHGGNQGPGAYGNWDAKKRAHGATLTEAVNGAFTFEPELLQFTAWNEFGAPDQFGVATSSDLEPTEVNSLRGESSDGWGYYYLDLMRDLVDQYRAGHEVPELTLDTRYP